MDNGLSWWILLFILHVSAVWITVMSKLRQIEKKLNDIEPRPNDATRTNKRSG